MLCVFVTLLRYTQNWRTFETFFRLLESPYSLIEAVKLFCSMLRSEIVDESNILTHQLIHFAYIRHYLERDFFFVWCLARIYTFDSLEEDSDSAASNIAALEPRSGRSCFGSSRRSLHVLWKGSMMKKVDASIEQRSRSLAASCVTCSLLHRGSTASLPQLRLVSFFSVEARPTVSRSVGKNVGKGHPVFIGGA